MKSTSMEHIEDILQSLRKVSVNSPKRKSTKMKKSKIIKLGSYDNFISWELETGRFAYLDILHVSDSDATKKYLHLGNKKEIKEAEKYLATLFNVYENLLSEIAKIKDEG